MNWKTPVIDDALHDLIALESFLAVKHVTQADIGSLDDDTAKQLSNLAAKCNDIEMIITKWVVAKGQMIQTLSKLKGENVPLIPDNAEVLLEKE